MKAAALLIAPVIAMMELGGIGANVSQILAENPDMLSWFVDALNGEALTAIGSVSSLA